ncbi:Serine/threonine protein kinase [Trema orientale]|uniref:non-specific serine/threonine protein kinase n=1 Tax=Trema orientale TaxID=63057 RepID=A0A2P5EVL7_TREOI|nr:Serine/threonine protein kinase [Trema orientale]
MKQDDSKPTDHDDPMRDSYSLLRNFMAKLSVVFVNTMFLLLLQHVVLTSVRAAVGHQHHHPRRSLATDRAALLEFKKAIIHDPYSKLLNWNDSVHICRFNGVRCDKHHHRVAQLILNDSGLVGVLSPFVSNLTGLRILYISNNQFFGTIPKQLSSLRHLRYLQIDGNNFEGPIIDSLSIFPKIIGAAFLNNHFKGTISPAFFSNCPRSLEALDLANNSFTGEIPVEIGNCTNLWSLSLYNNQFTGELPFSLTKTVIANLDIEYNNFTGELPSKIIGHLPGLKYLHLSYNLMESHDGNTNLTPFFDALQSCTLLVELELAGMNLGGRLPDSIGRLGADTNSISLQENKITGSIPPSISNLQKLNILNLSSNRLNETISAEIRNLPQLQQLFLSHNFFSGTIPEVFDRFPLLGLLDLSHNEFSGEIPASLGNLSRLNYLFLNNNRLSGRIPPSLGRCTELHKIDLSYNRLSGTIPSQISGMSEIRIFMNFSHNQLEGPLPLELSKLEDVQEIDLSSNNLSGSIFPQISSCIAVRLINFSNNSLNGTLPDSLGELKNLEAFDVSGNHLSGMIPTSLNKSRILTFLNLSFNDFEGMIPSGGIFSLITNLSVMGNPRLCGKRAGLHPCPRKRHLFRSRIFLIIFSLVIFISAFLSIICCVIGLRRIQIIISSKKQQAVRRKPRAPEPILNFPRITYRELSDATAGFDDQRLVGSGSYGRVYKGVLSDGTAIAVKVLHVQSGNSTKSFNRECQVLKRIRHRNLIRIITACSLPDFKALVLPYMANGSLDSRLYPHSGPGLGTGSSDLNLIQRVNICSDIAEGMAYLHHHSPVRVIHCDLKPSNVLLNDDMTALVSDFGIARLVMTAAGGNAAFENMGNSTANMLAGSIGYIAPEYGFGSITSTKGDVYSFGILVLEMVTRKRPTDDMFVGELSLHRWVKSHYHGRVEKVVDSSLVRASKDQLPEVKKMWEVAIGELIELGILCTQESPSTRPTMLDAADDLDRLKRYLTGDTTATFASSLGISSSTIGDD